LIFEKYVQMSIRLDVLVFDIDGVLIDVSESYRNATRQTVQIYLETCLNLPPCDRDLISHEDVTAFKLVGGFNNDWDLTTGILKYFLTRLDPQPVIHLSPEANSEEVMSFLREAGTHINTTVETMRQQKDILSFTRMLKTVGSGLDAVWKVLGAQNDHLLFALGDLQHTNLVQRIFQELYLGETYFSREYGEAPLIYNGPGLIQRERLIISPQVLAELGKQVPLGIATGRPRNEAIYALETANVLNRFRSLVALEDKEQSEQKLFKETGQQISLDKPHPFTLLEAVRRIASEHVRCAYIGDTPDDIRAANAAKKDMDFISIGCLFAAQEKETLRMEFERAGADIIINHPDELLKLVVAN
jgi:HAD superfamily phosphatase